MAGVKYDVHHSHVAQRCDRLGNATEERRNVVLAFTRRVRLREMERLPFIHATRMPEQACDVSRDYSGVLSERWRSARSRRRKRG